MVLAAVPALILGGAAAFQVPQSLAALSLGIRSGGFASGPVMGPYDDQFDEVMWMTHLTTIFDRRSAVFVVDSSVHADARSELAYYLDAPMVSLGGAVRMDPGELRGRHLIALADIYGGADVAWVARLARGHRTIVHQRRFVAIDLSDRVERLEAWERVNEAAGWGWCWLVNPVRPPVHWVRRLFAPVARDDGRAGKGVTSPVPTRRSVGTS